MLAALRSRMTAATLMSTLTPARPCATPPAANAARRRVPAIQQLHPRCRRGPPPASAVNGGYSSASSATGDRGGAEGGGDDDGSAGAAASSAPGDTAAGSVGSVAK